MKELGASADGDARSEELDANRKLAVGELEDRLNALDLDDVAHATLRILAADPHGIESSAAKSMLAGAIRRSMDVCAEAVQSLLERGLLQIQEGRLRANFEALGIDEEARLALQSLARPYQSLGSPHSAGAMESLRKWMHTETDTIYLGMGITSHRVFRDALEARAKNGFATVFIMPTKKSFTLDHHTHYEEVYRGWIEFLRMADGRLRRTTRLYVSPELRKFLHTSSLGSDRGRFDVYWTRGRTTRDGEMIEVYPGTSLYELLLNEYQNALGAATPILRLWPAEWLDAKWRHRRSGFIGGMLVAVAGALFLVAQPLAGLIGTAGMTLIVQELVEREWKRDTLF